MLVNDSETRVVLLGLPRMLCDIVRELVINETNIKVVAEVVDEDDLVRAVDATEANFVLVGCADGELPAACTDLMADRPRMQILAVLGGGRHGILFSLERARRFFDELSPDLLLVALGNQKPTPVTVAQASVADERQTRRMR